MATGGKTSPTILGRTGQELVASSGPELGPVPGSGGTDPPDTSTTVDVKTAIGKFVTALGEPREIWELEGTDRLQVGAELGSRFSVLAEEVSPHRGELGYRIEDGDDPARAIDWNGVEAVILLAPESQMYLFLLPHTFRVAFAKVRKVTRADPVKGYTLELYPDNAVRPYGGKFVLKDGLECYVGHKVHVCAVTSETQCSEASTVADMHIPLTGIRLFNLFWRNCSAPVKDHDGTGLGPLNRRIPDDGHHCDLVQAAVIRRWVGASAGIANSSAQGPVGPADDASSESDGEVGRATADRLVLANCFHLLRRIYPNHQERKEALEKIGGEENPRRVWKTLCAQQRISESTVFVTAQAFERSASAERKRVATSPPPTPRRPAEGAQPEVPVPVLAERFHKAYSGQGARWLPAEKVEFSFAQGVEFIKAPSVASVDNPLPETLAAAEALLATVEQTLDQLVVKVRGVVLPDADLQQFKQGVDNVEQYILAVRTYCDLDVPGAVAQHQAYLLSHTRLLEAVAARARRSAILSLAIPPGSAADAVSVDPTSRDLRQNVTIVAEQRLLALIAKWQVETDVERVKLVSEVIAALDMYYALDGVNFTHPVFTSREWLSAVQSKYAEFVPAGDLPYSAIEDVSFNGDKSLRMWTDAILNTKAFLYIAMFSLNHQEIVEAIQQVAAKAAQDGMPLRVRIAVDYGQFSRQGNRAMQSACATLEGIPGVQVMYVTGDLQNAEKGWFGDFHFKIGIFDGVLVLLGSINLSTRAVQYSRDFLVASRDLWLVEQFATQFQIEWRSCRTQMSSQERDAFSDLGGVRFGFNVALPLAIRSRLPTSLRKQKAPPSWIEPAAWDDEIVTRPTLQGRLPQYERFVEVDLESGGGGVGFATSAPTAPLAVGDTHQQTPLVRQPEATPAVELRPTFMPPATVGPENKTPFKHIDFQVEPVRFQEADRDDISAFFTEFRQNIAFYTGLGPKEIIALFFKACPEGTTAGSALAGYKLTEHFNENFSRQDFAAIIDKMSELVYALQRDTVHRVVRLEKELEAVKYSDATGFVKFRLSLEAVLTKMKRVNEYPQPSYLLRTFYKAIAQRTYNHLVVHRQGTRISTLEEAVQEAEAFHDRETERDTLQSAGRGNPKGKGRGNGTSQPAAQPFRGRGRGKGAWRRSPTPQAGAQQRYQHGPAWDNDAALARLPLGSSQRRQTPDRRTCMPCQQAQNASACEVCQGTGHQRSQCPTLLLRKRDEGGAEKRKEYKCYECGGLGHAPFDHNQVGQKQVRTPGPTKGVCLAWTNNGSCRKGEQCQYEHQGKGGLSPNQLNIPSTGVRPGAQPEKGKGAGDKGKFGGKGGKGKGKGKPGKGQGGARRRQRSVHWQGDQQGQVWQQPQRIVTLDAYLRELAGEVSPSEDDTSSSQTPESQTRPSSTKSGVDLTEGLEEYLAGRQQAVDAFQAHLRQAEAALDEDDVGPCECNGHPGIGDVCGAPSSPRHSCGYYVCSLCLVECCTGRTDLSSESSGSGDALLGVHECAGALYTDASELGSGAIFVPQVSSPNRVADQLSRQFPEVRQSAYRVATQRTEGDSGQKRALEQFFRNLELPRIVPPPAGDCPYLPARIGPVEVSVLLDTGAQANAISGEFAKVLLERQHREDLKLFTDLGRYQQQLVFVGFGDAAASLVDVEGFIWLEVLDADNGDWVKMPGIRVRVVIDQTDPIIFNHATLRELGWRDSSVDDHDVRVHFPVEPSYFVNGVRVAKPKGWAPVRTDEVVEPVPAAKQSATRVQYPVILAREQRVLEPGASITIRTQVGGVPLPSVSDDVQLFVGNPDYCALNGSWDKSCVKILLHNSTQSTVIVESGAVLGHVEPLTVEEKVQADSINVQVVKQRLLALAESFPSLSQEQLAVHLSDPDLFTTGGQDFRRPAVLS